MLFDVKLFVVFSDENLEKVELSELTVNPGQPKAGPSDFELLKLLGKGGYGKVDIFQEVFNVIGSNK